MRRGEDNSTMLPIQASIGKPRSSPGKASCRASARSLLAKCYGVTLRKKKTCFEQAKGKEAHEAMGSGGRPQELHAC